jgi:hypothetical protein
MLIRIVRPMISRVTIMKRFGCGVVSILRDFGPKDG